MEIKLVYKGTHKRVRFRDKIFIKEVPILIDLPDGVKIPINFEEFSEKKNKISKETSKKEVEKIEIEKEKEKPCNNC